MGMKSLWIWRFFYLICGYEMVLDLGFLEIGDSKWVWVCWWCFRCGCGSIGGVSNVGVWVCWWCCRRSCVGLLLVVLPVWVWVCWWCSQRGCVGLLVVLPVWVCGFVGGGVVGVGVALSVVFLAWVCGFVGKFKC